MKTDKLCWAFVLQKGILISKLEYFHQNQPDAIYSMDKPRKKISSRSLYKIPEAGQILEKTSPSRNIMKLIR